EIPTTLTKRGDVLEGVINVSGKAKNNKPRPVKRTEWDEALAEHVKTMADGETVDVTVAVDRRDGKRTVRLRGVAPLKLIKEDSEWKEKLKETGGFVNPYTFVPTLPRAGDDGSYLVDTGLDDAPPPATRTTLLGNRAAPSPSP